MSNPRSNAKRSRRQRQQMGRGGANITRPPSLDSLTSTRALATATIFEVIHEQRSLNTLLPAATASLDDRESALLQELVYGTCRWHFYLESLYSDFLNRPLAPKDTLAKCLLSLGSYQLLFMRIPTHAAINESVNAAEELGIKHHKGLTNAILRRVSELELDDIALDEDANIKSFPSWMIEKLKHNWPQHWQAIIKQCNQRPPLTLRVNKQQFPSVEDPRASYLSMLTDEGIDATATVMSDTGITLAQALDITSLPGFEEGFFSVQDEAAQLCSALLNLQAQQRVLDACAAPGGKTCAMLEHTAELEVLAIDNSEDRSQRIYDNLQRLQLKADVKVADAAKLEDWWDGKPFDRILLDAPCSASGVIRRHPDIKLLRHEGDIKALSDVQLTLLSALWETLKPEGELLYATCSVFPQENSRIIERFLKQQTDVQLSPLSLPQGVDTGYGHQLFPTDQGHDGFFYARLIKTKS